MKNVVDLEEYRKRKKGRKPMAARIAVIVLYVIFLLTMLAMCVYKIDEANRELQKIQYEDPYQEFNQ